MTTDNYQLPRYRLSPSRLKEILPDIQTGNNEVVMEKLEKWSEGDNYFMADDKRVTFNAIIHKNYSLVEHILNKYNQHEHIDYLVSIVMGLNDEKMFDIMLHSEHNASSQVVLALGYEAVKANDIEKLDYALAHGLDLEFNFNLEKSDIKAINPKYLFSDSHTLLSYACHTNRPHMVKALLARGALMDEEIVVLAMALPKKDKLPMLNALNSQNTLKCSEEATTTLQEKGQKDLVRGLLSLEKVQLDLPAMFRQAVYYKDHESMEKILARGMVLDFSSNELMVRVTTNSDKKAAKILLDRGAIVDIELLSHATPAFWLWLEEQPRFGSLEKELRQGLNEKPATKKAIKL